MIKKIVDWLGITTEEQDQLAAVVALLLLGSFAVIWIALVLGVAVLLFRLVGGF